MTDTPSPAATSPVSRLNIGSHDLPVSPELSRFMAADWAPSPSPMPRGSPRTSSPRPGAPGSRRASRASG